MKARVFGKGRLSFPLQDNQLAALPTFFMGAVSEAHEMPTTHPDTPPTLPVTGLQSNQHEFLSSPV